MLMKLSTMEHSVSPLNIKSVYEFLLEHCDVVPVDDVLKLFMNVSGNLFARIRVLHVKARLIEEPIKENAREMEDDYRLLKVDYNNKRQNYHIRANHEDMKIIWDY